MRQIAKKSAATALDNFTNDTWRGLDLINEGNRANTASFLKMQNCVLNENLSVEPRKGFRQLLKRVPGAGFVQGFTVTHSTQEVHHNMDYDFVNNISDKQTGGKMGANGPAKPYSRLTDSTNITSGVIDSKTNGKVYNQSMCIDENLTRAYVYSKYDGALNIFKMSSRDFSKAVYDKTFKIPSFTISFDGNVNRNVVVKPGRYDIGYSTVPQTYINKPDDAAGMSWTDLKDYYAREYSEVSDVKVSDNGKQLWVYYTTSANTILGFDYQNTSSPKTIRMAMAIKRAIRIYDINEDAFDSPSENLSLGDYKEIIINNYILDSEEFDVYNAANRNSNNQWQFLHERFLNFNTTHTTGLYAGTYTNSPTEIKYFRTDVEIHIINLLGKHYVAIQQDASKYISLGYSLDVPRGKIKDTPLMLLEVNIEELIPSVSVIDTLSKSNNATLYNVLTTEYPTLSMYKYTDEQNNLQIGYMTSIKSQTNVGKTPEITLYGPLVASVPLAFDFSNYQYDSITEIPSITVENVRAIFAFETNYKVNERIKFAYVSDNSQVGQPGNQSYVLGYAASSKNTNTPTEENLKAFAVKGGKLYMYDMLADDADWVEQTQTNNAGEQVELTLQTSRSVQFKSIDNFLMLASGSGIYVLNNGKWRNIIMHGYTYQPTKDLIDTIGENLALVKSKPNPSDSNIVSAKDGSSLSSLDLDTCNLIEVYKGRIYLAGSITEPRVLFASDVTNYDYFPRLLTVLPTTDKNEAINVIRKRQYTLMIPSSSEFTTLVGDGPLGTSELNMFETRIIYPGIGVYAPRTLVFLDNNLVYLSNDGIKLSKPNAFNESSITTIQRIDKLIKPAVSVDRKAIAFVDNGKYYIMYPDGTGFIYDFDVEGFWSEFSTDLEPFVDHCEYRGKHYVISGEGSISILDNNIYVDKVLSPLDDTLIDVPIQVDLIPNIFTGNVAYNDNLKSFKWCNFKFNIDDDVAQKFKISIFCDGVDARDTKQYAPSINSDGELTVIEKDEADFILNHYGMSKAGSWALGTVDYDTVFKGRLAPQLKQYEINLREQDRAAKGCHITFRLKAGITAKFELIEFGFTALIRKTARHTGKSYR